MGEEAKVAVRNIRRDAMDKAKAMKKAGELTGPFDGDTQNNILKIIAGETVKA